jgi:LmbE family N-acetylglucosaminyl deacetylase
VRELRPEVLVSFGPEGGASGHADHRAAWRWTDAAFYRAAESSVSRRIAPSRFLPVLLDRLAGDGPGFARHSRQFAERHFGCRQEIDRLKRKAFSEHTTQQDHLTLFNRFQDALQERE